MGESVSARRPRHKWGPATGHENIGKKLHVVQECPHCGCRRARPFGSTEWNRIPVAACYYRRPIDPDWMRKTLWVELSGVALPACVVKAAHV